jgi:hypothetical protein
MRGADLQRRGMFRCTLDRIGQTERERDGGAKTDSHARFPSGRTVVRMGSGRKGMPDRAQSVGLGSLACPSRMDRVIERGRKLIKRQGSGLRPPSRQKQD